MKILSHNDIISLEIESIECYNWVEDMLKGKEKVILPAKTSIKPTEDIFYNVMPSLLPECNAGGLKVVTRYPSRIPALDSQIMIFDYSNGNINALLDGNFITTMRTGAVAAHSIKLFAKERFKKNWCYWIRKPSSCNYKDTLSFVSRQGTYLKTF